MSLYRVGFFGLGVMGSGLAKNALRNGFSAALYSVSAEERACFAAKGTWAAFDTPEAFLRHIERPRIVWVMVPASAVDEVLQSLLPMMEPGDVIIDGGNSYYADTNRRCEALEQRGLRYLGVGVSGGEKGALQGPSLMAGGSVEGWIQGRSLLETMAARYEGEPCCAYLGSGGAGHFVKMVHNGIEYAMLQLYADGWQLLRRSSMPHDPIASVFDAWRVGPLAGYLTDAAAAVMRKQDERTGRPLVEVIRSAAGQKGTGRWTVEEAIRLGVYAPTICEAVFARALSQQENLRAAGSRALAAGLEAHCDAEALERAMLAGMLCCYAQGFDLIRQGCAQYGWEAQLRTVARIWRNGCIIRSSLLNDIEQVLGKEPDVPNLLLTKRFASVMAELQRPWRSVAAMAAMSGIAAPALVSTLIYYDSIRTADMPISLVQGMRDYFGAHGCERNDCCGIFHTDWEE